MSVDFIEIAKKEICSFLGENYSNLKFAVKFNGEFFIANANGNIPETELKFNLKSVSMYKLSGNKMFFTPDDNWLKDSISNIQETDCKDTDLMVYSQIVRLNKQIEIGLGGEQWNENSYKFAKDILYALHTKSESIRLNIVKRCACEYNKMQRQGRIPGDLIKGYKNALCQISGKF